MSNSKSRLGRGLGGLISGAIDSDSPTGQKTGSVGKRVSAPKEVTSSTSATTHSSEYQDIHLKDIVANPYQPRREINSEPIEELAQSIRSEGLLQPIVVRRKEKQFELIAGERRVDAFKHLKLEKIPARIIQAGDASSAALALIENLQRENLNPMDEALGYASLIKDFDLTQEAAAERVGRGRATVANALRLLTLDLELQDYLSRRLISTGHAKVLLSLESKEQQKLLARRIIETGMSVRETEARVGRLKTGNSGKHTVKVRSKESEQVALRDLEKRMSRYLNTPVGLKHTAKKGRITIEYYGNDDLDRILQKLGLKL